MKIMLAKPVATEKTHRPLQNRLRPTEAIALAIKRFQPINVARCLESTRPFKASFYSEEFRTGVRDRSLDHTRPPWHWLGARTARIGHRAPVYFARGDPKVVGSNPTGPAIGQKRHPFGDLSCRFFLGPITCGHAGIRCYRNMPYRSNESETD